MAISCSPFDRWPADRGGRPPRRIRGIAAINMAAMFVFNSSLTTSDGTAQFSGENTVPAAPSIYHTTVWCSYNKGGRAVFRRYFGHTVDNQSGVTCVYWFFVRKHQHNVSLAFVLDGSSGPQRDKLLFAPIDLQLLSLVEGSPWSGGHMGSYKRHLTASLFCLPLLIWGPVILFALSLAS